MKKLLILLLATSVLLSVACTAIDNEQSDANNSIIESDSISEASDDASVGASSDVIPDEDSSNNIEESSVVSAEESMDIGGSVESSESMFESNISTEESAEPSSSSADISESDESSLESAESDNQSNIPTKVFKSKGVLISGIRGMEQYTGSLDSGTKFSNIVGKFKDDLGDDVQVYTIVAPHASCYYAPESYSYLIESGRRNFENLEEKSAPDVHYIDVYNKLWEHVDEEIYPRTEHHWNALAAYYAAEEFAIAAGVNFPSLDSYEKIEMEGFVGTLYTFSGGASVLKNYPETLVAYKPISDYKAYYYKASNSALDNPKHQHNTLVYKVKSYPGAFLGGDSYSVKVETQNNTGRKLVIFKDSYGNCFVPFTVFSFDEIYVLDIRYYKSNGVSFCKNVGATDVAFVVSGMTATGKVYNYIESIRTYN